MRVPNNIIVFEKSSRWLVAVTILFAVGCAKSPKGKIEELVKTRAPTFQGASQRNYTTSSPPFVLNGECDPISYGVEWSYDRITWTEFIGGCPASVFTLNLNVIGIANVYVRARTKTGYTATAHAFIRYVLPPNSPYFNFVSSGHAGEEYATGNATQNAIEHNFTCDTYSNATMILKFSLIDAIYE